MLQQESITTSSAHNQEGNTSRVTFDVTWDHVSSWVKELSTFLKENEIVPDVILGVSRGGLTPGVMLSYSLNIPFYPLVISTRDFKDEFSFLTNIYEDIRRLKMKYKSILIVDDISDEGATLSFIKNGFNLSSDSSVKILVSTLVYKTKSKVVPDYTLITWNGNDMWFVFPWERL